MNGSHRSAVPRHTLRDRAKFFGAFLRNPAKTASVAPSSRTLALRMIRGIDLGAIKTLVEYGPGSGPITRVVCEHLPSGWLISQGGRGRFIAIEYSATLAEIIRETLPSVTTVTESAEHVEAICQAQGVPAGQVDCVISGLGWVSFPHDLTTRTLEATHRALKPGGEFRTFGYHMGLMMSGAWHFRREVNRLFSKVEVSRVVWNNLPPAFVYRCVK